jgi:flotillin
MNQAQDIIQGQMRSVIAALKVDDINQDWQAFTAKVGEAVAVELKKIGMTVININVKDITSTVEAGKAGQ